MSEMRQESPPVVLAHGWGGTYESTWGGSFLERSLIAAGRRIIRLDLPGHGRKLQSHDPGYYVNISNQLFTEFSDEPLVDAVGFSLGGKLLLDLAARYPARFRRLVIAGVGSNLFRPENGEMVLKAITATDPAEAPPGLRSIVKAVHESGNDIKALAAVICRPSTPMRPEELSAILASTLLIVGKDDKIVGDPSVLYVAMPSAAREVLDGVDHLGTASSPAFQELALRFLLARSLSTHH